MPTRVVPELQNGLDTSVRSAVARRLGTGRQPAQAPGNHEVDDQEQIALQREHDALAQAFDALDFAAFRASNRRLRSAQHEWAVQMDLQ